MCGRFAIFSSVEEIKKYADKLGRIDKFKPTYNAVPGNYYPVLNNDNGKIVLQEMRWGLIPFWAKDEKIGNKLINARAESVMEKPSFRTAYQKRRCAIPVNGFYEWNKQKQPFLIKCNNEEIFFLAGIWESWKNEQNENLETFCIITQKAQLQLKTIHHRMPLVLKVDEFTNWLEYKISVTKIQQVNSTLEFYPVSKAVNNPQNDGKELIKAVG